MSRVPRALRPILLVALLQALAWAVVLPAFQAQDEPVHFAYTQKIVESKTIPWTAFGQLPWDPPFSSEVYAAQRWSSLGPLALNVAMRPYFTDFDQRRWAREEAKLTDAGRSDGQYVTSMRNPPLYYLYETAVYAPLQNTSFFTRWFAMRLATIPFLLITVVAAWLLAGEVFGRRRWLQAVTALTVALQPMLAQLSGIINPDAAIAAVFAVGLWLAAVIVNRGATRPRVVGAVALVAAAALLHARAAPIAVPLVLALVWRAWPVVRARGPGAARAATAAAVAGGVAFFGVSLWLALRGDVGVGRVREFGSYLWQFYLPELGFMGPPPADWDARDVFVDRLWSGFSLLDVNLAPWVLDTIAWATVAGLVAIAATLVVRRASVPAGLAVVFAGATFGLLWMLHVSAFRELPLNGDPVLTGRYLTALLPLLGLGIAAIAASLPRRVGPGAAAVVLGLEALLAMSALGTAVVRFYV